MNKIRNKTKKKKRYSKISILILNWNGKENTIECLNSLKKINYPNYEIIILDNGSKDDSVKILRQKFPEARLIGLNKNLGYAGGNNLGIKNAALMNNAEYVLILNNDTIVNKNFLKQLVKIAESNKDTGIVCPKVYFYYKPNIIQYAGLRFDLDRGESILMGYNKKDEGQFEKEEEMDFCGGTCMLVKKEVFERIGLFDENYFAYFEDNDFGFRARKSGYKIMFAPKAEIWHKVSSSSGGKINAFKEYYMNRNRIWFMKKHANKKQLINFFLTFAFEFLISSASCIKKGKIGILNSKIKGIVEGVVKNA